MKFNYTLPPQVLEVIAAAFAGMTESYRADAGYSALYVHHHNPYDPTAMPELIGKRRPQWHVTDNFESTNLACLIFDYTTQQWTRRWNWSRVSGDTDALVPHAHAVELALKWFSQVERVNR